MLRAIIRRFGHLGRRSRFEQEFSEEVRFHIEERAAELEAGGVSRDEAFARARREFGPQARAGEESRAAWQFQWIEQAAADLRYAFRQIGRSPALALIIVLILGIGVGSSAAVFAEIHELVWKRLPVSEPEGLRWIWWRSEDPGFRGRGNSWALTEGHDSSFSHPAYRFLRDHTQSFSNLIAFDGMHTINVGIGEGGEAASGQLVSGNYFQVLGVRAAAGRLLGPGDDRPDAAPAAVLGYGFWQRVFGGDPAVVGTTIRVNGVPVEIVGVTAREFRSLEPQYWHPDVILPISLQPVVIPDGDFLDDPGNWSLMIFGRLRPGVDQNRARSETQALLQDAIAETAPSRPYAPPEVTLVSGARGLARSDDLPFSLVLGGAVGSILLVACANVAGLLVVRAAGRRHEIGTRLALGAGRLRLVRQLLTEAMVLSLLGGTAGAAVAFLLSDSVAEAGLEVLAFATLLTAGTGLAFGLTPALGATRISLMETLKKASPEIGGARSLGAKTLVAVQVALSLVLLIGAGLFFQTLFNLTTQPMGFSPENLLVFRADPSLNGYEGGEVPDFFETALSRIEPLQGVESASLSRWGMLTFSSSGERVCVPGLEPGGAATHSVAPRFLETMGVPLLAGRDFTWADREETPSVALVNQAFALRYFDGENPVGRTVRIGCGPDAEGVETRIVGLAGDAKYTNLRGPAPATLFIPYRQSSERWMTFAVRTTRNPAAMIPPIREAIAAIDPDVALYDMATQLEWIDLNVARERRIGNLVAAFAGVALLLSAMGIYGTLAQLVARRTSEIGLRIALGAGSNAMARMVVFQSLPAVAIGIGVGILAALGAAALIESMLYGVSSSDPVTILVAVAGLLIVSAFAAFLPARRATRIDPLVALRYE